jgi:protein-tyrosine phosphatase/arsenate reductase
MFQNLQTYCDQLTLQFEAIDSERKLLLAKLADYIQEKVNAKAPINLVYVCTHNSRRSHFGQIWAAVAANYYSIPNLSTFSGGTEATVLHPNAIQVLQTTGFDISTAEENNNPHYSVRFGVEDESQTTCFSKVYDDAVNPSTNFAAIMTCSDAETNCPFIPGVELRIATTYDDPKAFDHTPEQAVKYLERSNQIAVECLYVFSLIQL